MRFHWEISFHGELRRMSSGEEVWCEQRKRASIDVAAGPIGRWQKSIHTMNYSHLPLNSAKKPKTQYNFKYMQTDMVVWIKTHMDSMICADKSRQTVVHTGWSADGKINCLWQARVALHLFLSYSLSSSFPLLYSPLLLFFMYRNTMCWTFGDVPAHCSQNVPLSLTVLLCCSH